jgi:hypothetical protein
VQACPYRTPATRCQPGRVLQHTRAGHRVQHHASGGIVQTAYNLDVNVTYHHAFQNSTTGPWISDRGLISGTGVTSKMSENSLTIGFEKTL